MENLFHLNETDSLLCDALQKNGRIHASDLASLVNLTAPAVAERIRKLEERGVIQSYNAKLNPSSFDIDIAVFILVSVDSSANYSAFIERCKLQPEILECHATTGEASHILKVRTRNTASLEKFLSELQKWDGVRKSLTNLVLSTHKETFSIDTGVSSDEKIQLSKTKKENKPA